MPENRAKAQPPLPSGLKARIGDRIVFTCPNAGVQQGDAAQIIGQTGTGKSLKLDNKRLVSKKSEGEIWSIDQLELQKSPKEAKLAQQLAQQLVHQLVQQLRAQVTRCRALLQGRDQPSDSRPTPCALRFFTRSGSPDPFCIIHSFILYKR